MLLLSIKVENNETSKAQHKALLKALTAYMQTEYPALTTGELVLAYRLGVKYKLGIEMFAELNPRQVGKVLHAYEQYKREELTRNPAPQPTTLLAAPTPTPEQLDRSHAQLFKMAYQVVRQGREYRDLGSVIYDFLDRKELIPFDKGRKWDFMKQAQMKLQQEHANHGVMGNMQEHKDARSLAALLKDATEKNELLVSEKGQVTTRAKQLAFNTLLKELIEMDVTPDDFLQTSSVNNG